MLRFLKIYIVLTVCGWGFRLYWDLNHFYHWQESGDFFWGTGIALIIVGATLYVDRDVRMMAFEKVWKYWLYRSFTQLGFYAAISNLCDELFFDPYHGGWEEWATAAGVFVSLLLVKYVNWLYGFLKSFLE